MKQIRLIHTADWHLSEKSNLQKKARTSLDEILKFSSENKINGLLIAGDIWDRIQTFGNESAIEIAFEYLTEFSRLIDFIYIIKGNNSHDAPRSIDLLHKYKSNIYAFEGNVASGISIQDTSAITNLIGEDNHINKFDLIIHGLSYPTKANLLNGNSIDLQNDNFVYLFEELAEFHGSISRRYTETPKITLFHGNVSGARLSNGQNLIGQDIIIPSFVLEKTFSDYYALGHIHLPQNISDKMRYSGSLYNKDFGETEQKYFDLIEFENTNPMVKNIPFQNNRPMVIVDAEFIDGKLIYNKNIQTNAEIKFRYSVNQLDRELITSKMISEIKKEFGDDIIIEAEVIPLERISRSNQIMLSKSLVDEVEEYAKIIGEEVCQSTKEKISNIELQTHQEYELCA